MGGLKVSYRQHRLLRGICYPQILEGLRRLAEEVGEDCPIRDEDHLHETTLHLARINSTANLTRTQFDALVEWIVAYWSQRGILVELKDRA